ncbi:MAG: hypothetical protein U0R49_02425 [Fimbriimonadales bacterium]
MAVAPKRQVADKRTFRLDAWWAQPATCAFFFSVFVLWATFRAFENNFYSAPHHLHDLYQAGKIGDLLSPMYSPLIPVDWNVFGKQFSPAILILVFPLSFRLTCYYFRRMYYRSYFFTPPACAVEGTSRKGYTGERNFPLTLQNLHRFTWYFDAIFILLLAYDVVKSMQYVSGWGVSVGTFVLLLDVLLLGAYTFGCHSCRHACGGCVNSFSKHKGLHRLWKLATRLNERHAEFAWISLVWVGLTDVYVRLVTSGVIQDVVFARFG